MPTPFDPKLLSLSLHAGIGEELDSDTHGVAVVDHQVRIHTRFD
jgi:hypothetical protein